MIKNHYTGDSNQILGAEGERRGERNCKKCGQVKEQAHREVMQSLKILSLPEQGHEQFEQKLVLL